MKLINQELGICTKVYSLGREEIKFSIFFIQMFRTLLSALVWGDDFKWHTNNANNLFALAEYLCMYEIHYMSFPFGTVFCICGMCGEFVCVDIYFSK